jgi:hypothetical protein
MAVIYQRFCELDPRAGIPAYTDIMLGFSSVGAEIERQSGWPSWDMMWIR